MIVHFGHCCLSTETQALLPGAEKSILYVLPRGQGVNWEGVRTKIKEMRETEGVQVLIYSDLALIGDCATAFTGEAGISVGIPNRDLVRTIPALV